MENILRAIAELKKETDFDLQKEIFEYLELDIKVFFKQEEKLHAEYEVPDRSMHMKLHHEFVRSMTSFNYQYFLTTIGRTEDVFLTMMEFMALWLKKHRSSMDEIVNSFMRTMDFTNGKR